MTACNDTVQSRANAVPTPTDVDVAREQLGVRFLVVDRVVPFLEREVKLQVMPLALRGADEIVIAVLDAVLVVVVLVLSVAHHVECDFTILLCDNHLARIVDDTHGVGCSYRLGMCAHHGHHSHG